MKVAILGFGKEGESAFRYWSRLGCVLTIHDNNKDKDIPSGAESILGDNAFDALDQYHYDLLVRSPGLRLPDNIKTPTTTPTREFLRHCPAPVIGVTGTKGKGTTATLIAKILQNAGRKVHLLGNIGYPALDELVNINQSDIVVFEMSSFQLFDIDISPHVAVCLMVTEDHLDWHQDLDEYRLSKANIFKFQKANDVAVYYSDNPTATKLSQSSSATKVYSYGGVGSDVFADADRIVAFGHKVINITDIALPGRHNLQNVCAAIAGSWEYNQQLHPIQKALKEFAGLPLHIELIAKKNGICFYNDSFSTNPIAAMAAIESFDQPLVLFLGGFDKGADFDELAKTLKGRRIRKIITYGQTGQKILETLANQGVTTVEYLSSQNFSTIIRAGVSVAQSGDIVLLSPACASWGMFTDYKARGQQFNKIVEEL